MSGPVVADRRQELGRQQRAVVGLPDGHDRTLALGWSSFGLRYSRWGILPPRFREFSRNRRCWRRGHIPPVVIGKRKRRLLGCRERNPDLVLVSRATFGMGLDRQSKRIGVQIVPFTFAAVVAGDCWERGIELVVIDLFVLAILVAISLAFCRDRDRELELAGRGTIEPTNGGCRSGPDDVATTEVVPEGKREDEQEEAEHYVGSPGQSCQLGERELDALTKDHVEEGKGMKNAVASVIDLVRI
jgi:hypothetical protein